MKIIIVSGGFDPIHSGHIEHFRAAKELGDLLIVGLNSDSWLTRKKGKPFMTLEERLSIVRELRTVDLAIGFNDDDDSSRDLIEKVLELYDCDVVFANGGDRTHDNIPEVEQFKDNSRVSFEFGVGGDNKKNSSSWILENWRTT
tara:strand:+ start:91 stop:522 length:432 start_codon:yes stop_codon:yes gene_type:complete